MTSMPRVKIAPDWARWASEIFQPPLTLAALLVALSWGANPGVWSLGWGLAAAVVVCGVPLSVVLVLVRRGVLTDHHVSEKAQRRPVMIGTLVMVVGFLIATLFFNGPVEIVGLLASTVLAGTLLAVVSPWWKISGHGMMMGGTVVVLTVSWGPFGLLFIPVALFVSWSRTKLQAHSGSQVIAGFLYGVVVLGGIYAWLVL